MASSRQIPASRPGLYRLAIAALALGSATALGATLYRYLTPLSGVTGTPGALLAMIGACALLAASLVLLRARHTAMRRLFLGLSWLGAILTLTASLFLHGWVAAGALAVALLGVALASVARPAVRNERG